MAQRPHNEQWTPILEDSVVRTDDEMLQLGVKYEHSATDDQYWCQTLSYKHQDSELQQIGLGTIDWIVFNFNSRCQKPGLEFRSSPVGAGGMFWNLLIIPRDGKNSHLGLYLECKSMKEPFLNGKRNFYENVSSPIPHLRSDAINRIRETRAIVQFVMYNPQEPRTHFSRSLSCNFSVNYPIQGFATFGRVPTRQLGSIQPQKRTPILSGDKLAFRTYFRLFTHPIPVAKMTNHENFYQSGLRGLIPTFTKSLPGDGSLVAAVALCILLPQLREEIYRIDCPIRELDARQRPLPLISAIQDVLIKMRIPPRSSVPYAVPLGPVEEALLWHGMELNDGKGPLETLDILEMILHKEKVLAHHPQQPLNRMSPLSTNAIYDLFRDAPYEFLHCKVAAYGSRKGEFEILNQNLRQNFGLMIEIRFPMAVFNDSKQSWDYLKFNSKLRKAFPFKSPDSAYILCGLITFRPEVKEQMFTTYVRPDGNYWYTVRNTSIICLSVTQADCEIFKNDKCHVIVARFVRKDLVERAKSSPPEKACREPVRWLPKEERDELPLIKRIRAWHKKIVMENLSVDFKVFQSSKLNRHNSLGYFDIFDENSAIARRAATVNVPIHGTFSDIKREIGNRFKTGFEVCDFELWAIHRNKIDSRMPILSKLSLSHDTPVLDLMQKSPLRYIWLHISTPGGTRVEDMSRRTLSSGYESTSNSLECFGRPERLGIFKVPLKVLAQTMMYSHGEYSERDLFFNDVNDKVDEFNCNSFKRWQMVPQGGTDHDRYRCILKVFNPLMQVLIMLGSYEFRADGILDVTLRRFLQAILKNHGEKYHKFLQKDSSLEYFIEKPGATAELIESKSKSFLDHMTCFNLKQWDIIIISLSLSADDRLEVVRSGGLESIASFLKYLSVAENYIHRIDGPLDRYLEQDSGEGSRVCCLKYKGKTYKIPFSRGEPHGYGLEISADGDKYQGHITMGSRFGFGTMLFHNGDKYVGDWRWDQMDGQGTYTWAGTGNSYKGEFKSGRRCGSGVMTYKKFDDDRRLCSICYDKEVNCVFLDCGHVCACLSCGEQLRTCPTCRKRGIRVQKIYW